VKNPPAIKMPHAGPTIGDRLADQVIDGRSPGWHSDDQVGGELSIELAFQRAIEHTLKLVAVEKSSEALARLAQAAQFLTTARGTYYLRRKA
jgi:hypothetical protein